MDAALFCGEDFEMGLRFKFRQAVLKIFYFMYPPKMGPFWKGLAMVSVNSNGTKMIILGEQII